ncbi:MAG: hypothetical protein AAGE94_08115 [Acidobacteriota bacterium]
MSWRGYAALILTALILPWWLDAHRPWKQLQHEGLEARRDQLLAALDATAEATADEIRFREQAVVVAGETIDRRSDEIAELERLHFRIGRQLRAAEARWAAARRDGDPEAVLAARTEVEAYAEVHAEGASRLAALRVELVDAEAALDAARRPVGELVAELAAVERGRRWRRLPVVGALALSHRVREIAPTGLVVGADGHVRPRIDRCTTCHVGTADAAARVEPSDADPWRRALYGAHPEPELIGVDSPHPFAEVGCTACHGGDGAATDFARAGHRPRTAEQAAVWRRQWGWRAAAEAPAEGWILAGSLSRSSCVTCHGDAIWIEGASEAVAGRRLVAELGCVGCHTTGRPDLDAAPLAGPSLEALGLKTSAGALRARLADPSDRLWTTWGHGEDSPLRDPLLAEVMVTTLFSDASVTLPPATVGDAAAGANHFEGLGCRACHRLGEPPDLERIERLRGPDLEGLGRRATADWVRAWLLDPSAWRPDTLMPDLRLTPSVAADLGAFLVAPAGGSGDDRSVDSAVVGTDGAVEAPDPAAVDRRLTDALHRTMTIEASAAHLETLDPTERVRALGEATLERAGCAGCHRLASGLDVQRPDGGDLTAIGQRLARRFGAGEIPLDWPHRHSSRDDAPSGELVVGRSPVAGAVLTQTLGWRPSPSPLRSDRALADGRAVMERHGCRACHVLDGSPGLATSTPGPPPLDRSGGRLRSDWLVDYLHDPSSVTSRPWLTMPMPSFGLDDDALDAVARGFATRAGVPVVIPNASDGLADATADAATARAVGRAVFDMVQCGRCHVDREDAGGLDVAELAPSYRDAHRRLRPEWVEALLLDPSAVLGRLEGDGMPRVFPLDAEGRPDSRFLAGALDAPMFEVQRARLLRLFGDDDALRDVLDDPEQVTRALRAHLWTLDDGSP